MWSAVFRGIAAHLARLSLSPSQCLVALFFCSIQCGFLLLHCYRAHPSPRKDQGRLPFHQERQSSSRFLGLTCIGLQASQRAVVLSSSSLRKTQASPMPNKSGSPLSPHFQEDSSWSPSSSRAAVLFHPHPISGRLNLVSFVMQERQSSPPLPRCRKTQSGLHVHTRAAVLFYPTSVAGRTNTVSFVIQARQSSLPFQSLEDSSRSPIHIRAAVLFPFSLLGRFKRSPIASRAAVI